MILLISASQVAKITGVSHWFPANVSFLFETSVTERAVEPTLTWAVVDFTR
jgi:hypothetical protein